LGSSPPGVAAAEPAKNSVGVHPEIRIEGLVKKFGSFAALDGLELEVTNGEVHVVGGSGRVKLDDEILELTQWDTVRVAPSTVRAFEGGPDGLELLAIGSDRPEDGDGVRSTNGGQTRNPRGRTRRVIDGAR
jgi:hypothetical protein